MLSAYEIARLAQIKSNEAELAALKLSFKRKRRRGAGDGSLVQASLVKAAAPSHRPRPKQKRTRKAAAEAVAPTRTSRRLLRNIDADGNKIECAAATPAAPRQGTVHQGAVMKAAEAVAPTRTSRRLRNIDADGNKIECAAATPAAPRQGTVHQGAVIAPWAARLMASADATAAVMANSKMWSPRHCHQHLMLSRNRRIVATVGCAGYGACFASSEPEKSAPRKQKKTEKKKEKKTKKKAKPVAKNCKRASNASNHLVDASVKVLRFGTGGFAVGAALSTRFRFPFKSVGKHPFGVAYKEDGSLWHNKVEHEEFGQGYQEGDVVRVIVASDHAISFRVNGKPHGAPFSLCSAVSAAGSNEVVLAVQPYMGGAAMLTS
jgi:hypothetical protein